MQTTTPQSPAAQQSTGRLYFWLGLTFPLLGIAIYMAQLFVAKILKMPWYLPLFGTVGVLLVVLALVRKRTVWRFAGLVVACFFAFVEWYFVVGSGLRLPEYTGPVAAGAPFPTFAATFADGTPFTQDSLRSDKNTAMVFFRGRW